MIARFSVRVTVVAGIIIGSVTVVAGIVIGMLPVASPSASPVVVVLRDGERIKRRFFQPYNRRFADE